MPAGPILAVADGGLLWAQAAGLGTAFLWSISALCWSASGRRVGALPVTVLRLLLASAIMLAVRWVWRGSPIPEAPPHAAWLLVLSGVTGMALGDFLLFISLVKIGPRLGMLILSLCPIVTAIIAWVFTGESIDALGVAGIALTVGGIVAVVSGPRPPGPWHGDRRRYLAGIGWCLLSVLCASTGFVLTRTAMAWCKAENLPLDDFDAAAIRILSGTALCWVVVPLIGQLGQTLRACHDRKAMLIVTLGTIVGPVTGVWLCMIAFHALRAGIATALISTSPIMMIPLGYFLHRDRPGWRGLIGTAVAIVGVFLLVWRNQ